MTLYLKYRPQIIDELDLAQVRDTLKKIIASGEIPHGFLFSGPKGTGKTSSARILAKVINCENPPSIGGEPCNNCEACLSIIKGTNIDVIELDAASNRGIDDVRSLKETIMLAPSTSKKKVYIIDEAHMLTTEAANALLKTLEEPPAHVIFILATTNPEKLPGTVRSRLVNVAFQKASHEEIKRQISRVAKGEKLKIEEAAVIEIAKAADGSFRDAVKILEGLSWENKNITKKDALKFLERSGNNSVDNFFQTLQKKDAKLAIELIEKLTRDGISMKPFLDEVIRGLHKSLLAKVGISNDDLKNFTKEEVLDLIEGFGKARFDLSVSPFPELPIEIAIIKWSAGKQSLSLDDKETLPLRGKKKEIIKIEEVNEDLWKKLLDTVRNKNTSIEALLRSARPLGMDKGTLVIGVYYQFYKERLEAPLNRRIIEEVVCDITGQENLKVSYELTEKSKSPTAISVKEETLTTASEPDIIEAAKEIFG